MTRRLILALAPAALALATLAHAQPAGGPHAAHAAAPDMKAHHEALQKQHAEDMKTVLRLRPDQEAALAVFMEAHQPPVHEMKGPPEPKALTTPQRLDEMAKREAAMSAQHERMRQALAKFYAALTPEQQKAFDALQRLKGPHGGPMMMHGGHGAPRMMMKMQRHGGAEGPPPGHQPPR